MTVWALVLLSIKVLLPKLFVLDVPIDNTVSSQYGDKNVNIKVCTPDDAILIPSVALNVIVPDVVVAES